MNELDVEDFQCESRFVECGARVECVVCGMIRDINVYIHMVVDV